MLILTSAVLPVWRPACVPGQCALVCQLFSVLVAVVAIGRSGTILLNADKSVVILDKFVVGHSSSRFQLVFKVICFWKVDYYSNSSHQYSYLSNFKKIFGRIGNRMEFLRMIF